MTNCLSDLLIALLTTQFGLSTNSKICKFEGSQVASACPNVKGKLEKI
jgi:hypothetical protein